MGKETGGPAFPATHPHGKEDGMTLRDYFAAMAMQALVGADFRQEFTAEEDASYAYKMADAMLKERNK